MTDAEEHSRLRQLRRDFGDWLGGPAFRWSHFATFTFSKTPGRRAVVLADEFLHELAVWLGRDNFTGFLSMEIGPSGGRHHVHALLEFCGVASGTIQRRWQERFGFARVSAYNPKLGGLHYVTKYVIKDACGTADWRIVSTPDEGADGALFRPAVRVTGYQLFTRYTTLMRRKRAD